jgi:hypothetical protein
MIGASMSTADDDVATRREDVADDVASGKDPGVQENIIDTADESGMGLVQNNYVGSLARSQAATWFIQPERPHPTAARCVQQRAAG